MCAEWWTHNATCMRHVCYCSQTPTKKNRTIILITIAYDLSDLATKTISLQQLCGSHHNCVCILFWFEHFEIIFQKCFEFHSLIICVLMSMKDTTFVREFQLKSKWKHFNSIVPLLKCHFYKGKPGFSSFNSECVHIDNS